MNTPLPLLTAVLSLLLASSAIGAEPAGPTESIEQLQQTLEQLDEQRAELRERLHAAEQERRRTMLQPLTQEGEIHRARARLSSEQNRERVRRKLQTTLRELDKHRAELREQLQAAEQGQEGAIQRAQLEKLRELARQSADASRRAATEQHEQLREELHRSQAEMARLAAHIATLSVDLQAEDYAKALRADRFNQPRFGVLLQADPSAGALISGVTFDGPAEQAGLRSGDRLLSINGEALLGSAEQRLQRAQDLLQVEGAEKTVKLEVETAGKPRSISITARPLVALAVNPALQPGSAPIIPASFDIAPYAPSLICGEDSDSCRFDLYSSVWRGLRLAELNPELGRYFGHERGVLVLTAGASMEGVEGGDVWLSIDDQPVHTPDQAMRALRPTPGTQHHNISFARQREMLNLKVSPAATWRLPIDSQAGLPKGRSAELDSGLLQRLIEQESAPADKDRQPL
ncbi:PDZ domain-containing protein [Pseudomarimonas arenosa]|uniref:PDZ domain-containing protein n=1 Tax=Pseudomarimonas arenosa TaxID=2774145 RepID=A0AAW3ZMJ9_9GAMM|nr:PDZ domain-containing protein [Pseudomarimonas arenosa]MBD8526135.1 PDZ domain-containing protein [Pseudomarimonas arenosa]